MNSRKEEYCENQKRGSEGRKKKTGGNILRGGGLAVYTGYFRLANTKEKRGVTQKKIFQFHGTKNPNHQ